MGNTMAEAVIGALLVTLALLVVHVFALPLWVVLALLVTGAVLAGEGLATAHNEQAARRLERSLAVRRLEAKAPAPVVQPGVPRNVKALVWDWANNKPTSRRYAEEQHGVSEEQWSRTVQWAVRHGLGELVPGEGGNRKLRFTATINEALTVLDGLAVMA